MLVFCVWYDETVESEMLESHCSDLFDNFLIGCSCIIGTCSWFARSLCLPVSHSIVLSLVTLFSSVFMRWWWFFMIIRTLNLLHLRWGSVPSIPPIFSGVITFRHSVSPSSSAPISVLSFQSNSSFFPSRYQGGARIGHLQTHMNESGPAHFLGLFTKVYWLSVWRNGRRERWGIHRWEGRTLNISHY